MSDKDKILKDLYYNESGYQSINNLYKEAKEKDKSIAFNYVKGWYNHFNEPKFIACLYDYFNNINIENVNWIKERPITQAYKDMAS